MMSEEIMMKKVKPFWGRVTVIESDVEEQEHHGIIVPVKSDDFFRAVVVDFDIHHMESDTRDRVEEQIEVGTVVFVKGDKGTKIGDLLVVEWPDILAYEVRA